jgi:sugar phosphate permease
MRYVWLLPMFGSFIGGIDFLFSTLTADSAPKQAAGAGMALCWVVLPYVFARAVEGIAAPERNEEKPVPSVAARSQQ